MIITAVKYSANGKLAQQWNHEKNQNYILLKFWCLACRRIAFVGILTPIGWVPLQQGHIIELLGSLERNNTKKDIFFESVGGLFPTEAATTAAQIPSPSSSFDWLRSGQFRCWLFISRIACSQLPQRINSLYQLHDVTESLSAQTIYTLIRSEN